MKIDYLLQISYPPELEEIVFGRLFLTRSNGNMSVAEGMLSAYFESAADRESAADALRDLPIAIRQEDREPVNWLDRYQQSLTPLLIGKSFVVAADASLLTGDRPHRLVIPQAQAFGTGSHESTALSIELLEEIDLHNARGLDIGCGTGILSFAMLRLGARKVVGLDIDLDAIGAMDENRACNHAPAAFFIGTLHALRDSSFDIVTMNILPEIIIPLLPAVMKHVRGSLILSGILHTLRDDVVKGLRLVSERENGEWWAGRFTP
ncbi:MAG TPA: 50S ribosomal protein L11 methyltransferase [Thermoanaerobaculia bacterium]|nr:50S ribosomal protein L11 methyltransferase [Thermoanaerobaculia bacterium]